MVEENEERIEWESPCDKEGKCLENEAIGEETDICRDGCVWATPKIKLPENKKKDE